MHRKTMVVTQLKSSRMLLALSSVYDGEDKQIQCKSTMDRVAEGSKKYTEAVPSLNSRVEVSSRSRR